MITNPDALDHGNPPPRERWKLSLVHDHILMPIASRRVITITSAYRSPLRQQELRLDPATAALAAKGLSQHELGEAVDIVSDDMIAAYLDHLHDPIWQFILYLASGKARSLHVSLRSEAPHIERKRLIKVNADWLNYDGQDLTQLARSTALRRSTR